MSGTERASGTCPGDPAHRPAADGRAGPLDGVRVIDLTSVVLVRGDGSVDFELAEEHRMLKDIVERFVRDELIPLEPRVLEREASGQGATLTPQERERIDARSRELGLWGLDAPEEMGGSNLPVGAMVGVNEALMTYEAAWRVDRGIEARTQVSMIKAYATETAWEVIDRAMQIFGAMGSAKELPLQQMANEARLMRVYEGPTEVHTWVVARNVLGARR